MHRHGARTAGPAIGRFVMPRQSHVSATALKRAIEGRDGDKLSSFYADDAVITIIDRNNPPSRPRQLAGQPAISTYWHDVCGRDMTHRVDVGPSENGRLAFTEACSYADGTKVFCAAMIELDHGRIKRQTVVQAWDE
jgi:ketosteroid isomerase-like protein